MVPVYLCPTSQLKKMATTAPRDVQTPEIINGVVPYTAHYYGVMGPLGTNPVTGAAYLADTTDGDATHGGFAKQGIFQRDLTTTAVSGSEIGTKMVQVSDGTSNTLMVGEM